MLTVFKVYNITTLRIHISVVLKIQFRLVQDSEKHKNTGGFCQIFQQKFLHKATAAVFCMYVCMYVFTCHRSQKYNYIYTSLLKPVLIKITMLCDVKFITTYTSSVYH